MNGWGEWVDVRAPDDPDDDPTGEGAGNVWSDEGASSMALRTIQNEAPGPDEPDPSGDA